MTVDVFFNVLSLSHGEGCNVRSDVSWRSASEEIAMQKASATVPEGSEITGAGDELESLVQKLAGHQTFGRCRDTFQYNVIDMIEFVLRECSTRAEAQVALRKRLGDIYIMGSMLAGLRFTERRRAYNELRRALITEDFVLTGEVVPVEKTRPVTILMLEPKSTFVLLEWMTEAKTAELYSFLGIPDRHGRELPPAQEVTRRFFAEFPTLSERVRSGRSVGNDNGLELAGVFKDKISGLSDQFEGALPLVTADIERLLRSNATGGCGSMFDFPIAWMFPGRDQASVLGMFNRKDQKRVATWQMHVPEITLRYNSLYNYVKIGFHPEQEHRQWSQKLPAFASKGVSLGYGTMFQPSDSADLLTLEEYRNEETIRIETGKHSWTSKTQLRAGKKPRILVEVRADREQIMIVNAFLKAGNA